MDQPRVRLVLLKGLLILLLQIPDLNMDENPRDRLVVSSIVAGSACHHQNCVLQIMAGRKAARVSEDIKTLCFESSISSYFPFLLIRLGSGLGPPC